MRQIVFILAVLAFGFLPEVASAKGKGSGGGGRSSSKGSSSSKSSGGSVHVKGYTRKDGTYVAPHTRSSPGMGVGRSSGYGGGVRQTDDEDDDDTARFPGARTQFRTKPRTTARTGSNFGRGTGSSRGNSTEDGRGSSEGDLIETANRNLFVPKNRLMAEAGIQPDELKRAKSVAEIERDAIAQRERDEAAAAKQAAEDEAEQLQKEKKASQKLRFAKDLIRIGKVGEAQSYLKDILTNFSTTKAAIEAKKLIRDE